MHFILLWLKLVTNIVLTIETDVTHVDIRTSSDIGTLIMEMAESLQVNTIYFCTEGTGMIKQNKQGIVIYVIIQ